mgnify:CR=1 FL=1
MKNDLQRLVFVEPAYDKRDDDPKKNYGIHGVSIRFVLKGAEGVVQFLIYTNWFLPHNQAEMDNTYHYDHPHLLCRPMGADKGYHSPKPMYDGQITMGPCEYLDGKPCYYDGSGLNADALLRLMIREGGEAMWKDLEAFYHDEFCEREKEMTV